MPQTWKHIFCGLTLTVIFLGLGGCAAPLHGQGQLGAQTVPGAQAAGDDLDGFFTEMRPTQDKDLWARMRRGFAMPDLQDSYVTSQETWYANRPEYIGRMTERSRKYLYHIVEELERRRMPTELALLPFVESAFNPQAVSGVKAAGMWQFMPATGKYFSLKQNAFSDDRRDVQASTRAALDYLQKLYGMFGDWHLALAAYNWGEGSVMRAISRNNKAGLGTTYTDLTMPNETRNYVPKLQAIKNIVADPARFDATLPDIPNHPYFRPVPIERDIDVALAAKLAEVDLATFKALNPAAKQSMIVASGTPRILLPWDNAEVFRSNLKTYPGPLASYTAWVVPKTMRLGDAARHSGMEEGALRALNNIPKGMLVRGGSTLLVERAPDQEAGDISQLVANNAKVEFAPEITMQKTYIRAGRGETVAQLAKRYGVSASSLASWNDISTKKRLKKGQSLVVMVPTPYGEQAHAPTARTAFAETKTSCKGKGKKRVCDKFDAGDEQEKRLVTRSKKGKKDRVLAQDDGEKKSSKQKDKKGEKKTAKADKAEKKGKGKALAMADGKANKKRKD